MKLDLLTELAILLEAKFSFTLCVHVNLVSLGNVILVFTHGTNQSNYLAGSFFGHISAIVSRG